MKVLKIYIGNCLECPRIHHFDDDDEGWVCTVKSRPVISVSDSIPDWCPLPDKTEWHMPVDADYKQP